MKYRSYMDCALVLLTWCLVLANNIGKNDAHSSSDVIDDCFDIFGERTTIAAHAYGESYDKCQHHGIFRSSTLTREKETEKEQIKNGTVQICNSMENCNQYEAHEDFFHCYAAVSLDNLDTLINIHLNASAVVIDLSTEYEQAEKEVRLCVIEAQRTYTTETREALNDLRICLEN